MAVKIKICGVKEKEALFATVDAGADFVGLVVYPRSPRNIGISEAAELISEIRGRIDVVVLCVNPADHLLEEITRVVNPDWFQLHGGETPDRVLEIRKKFGIPVIKAIGISTLADIEASENYKKCTDLLLFDAKPPVDGKSLPGGNGLSFDWTLLKNMEKHMNFMLSGGLNPDNVRSAIELTGASAVDVSSGVEKSPGEKDPELIRKFIASAHSAF